MEISENPLLPICMIGFAITRIVTVLFSLYLILWIQTFATGEGGNPVLLESKERGKTIYQNIMVISVLISGFVFPFIGQLCDLYHPKIIIPAAFITRFFTTLVFSQVDNPDSYFALVTCILMILGTIIEMISIDSIFNKNLPKETRGVLTGACSFCGQLGILVYSMISGWIFDHVGPSSPFYLVGVIDILFALLVIIRTRYGLFSVYEAKERHSLEKKSAVSHSAGANYNDMKH